MHGSPVSRAEFEARLKFLCSGPRRNLPRKLRDRHIVLKAASSRFDGNRQYDEMEVNMLLRAWLTEVGSTLRLDHVTLRRHLVDYGYLERSPSGDRYFVLERAAVRFAADVAMVDQTTLLRGASG